MTRGEYYRVFTGDAEIETGEHAGATSATQLPDINASLVYIKATVSNAGNVYVGVTGVTAPDGSTDTTTGFELTPGDQLGPLPVNNLNELFIICDNAGDDITYMVLKA